MAIFLKGKSCSLSRLKSLTLLQRLTQTTEGRWKARLYPEVDSDIVTPQDNNVRLRLNDERVDTSKWRKVDARTFGIIHLMIPHSNCSFSLLKSLTLLQRLNHTTEGRSKALYPEMDSDSVTPQDNNARLRLNDELVDMSKWRKMDARTFGITHRMIPPSSWIVLKVLREHGFEAYLVGGCVRDLLLNKVPKDFDVITTANLKEIQKQFHRSHVVGQRFPICRVHIKGSVIEVSSFDTVARNAKEKERVLLSQMPSSCDEKDFMRWRNSMHRDFTINSLFFDPFLYKIYDYANGMADLRSLKLRTLVPAHLSFKEDCARILRGLRIAARLGLSFSKDTETAIHNLSSSVECLGQPRIMMELNSMLSYGAAEPSICLLRRFNLLGTLLPFQAAYMDQEASKRSVESSMMLMKLFFNMDKLISCDQPADCRLWVGLLAFHLALVKKPQEARIIWAFASVLYHGKWMEAIRFAREHSKLQVKFVPEISESSEIKSDGGLAKEVTQLVSLVQESVNALTETDVLLESMSRYPAFPCSGSVFVPWKIGRDVAQIFNVLVSDIESYDNGKENFMINYYLLGKGNPLETRFVLGKIILETMRGGLVEIENPQQLEVAEENSHLTLSDMVKHQFLVKKDRKRGLQLSTPEPKQYKEKKQKLPLAIKNQELALKDECHVARKHHKVVDMCQVLGGDTNVMPGDMVEKKKCHVLQQEMTVEKEEAVENDKVNRMKKKQKLPLAIKNQELALKEECHVAGKNQKVVDECQLLGRDKNVMPGDLVEKKKCHVLQHEMTVKKKEAVESNKVKHMKMFEKVKHHILQDKVTKKQLRVAEKCNLSQDEIINQEKCLERKNCNALSQEVVKDKTQKQKWVSVKEKGSRQLLSSLFK